MKVFYQVVATLACIVAVNAEPIGSFCRTDATCLPNACDSTVYLKPESVLHTPSGQCRVLVSKSCTKHQDCFNNAHCSATTKKCVAGKPPMCKANEIWVNQQCRCADTAQRDSTGKCVTCPAGTFGDPLTQKCLDCPAGNFCMVGIRTACPTGTSSLAKSSTIADCKTCEDGFQCLGGVDKKPCPSGSFCVNGVSQFCAGGSWSNSRAKSQKDCFVCPRGEFCYRGTRGKCDETSISPDGGLDVCKKCTSPKRANPTRTACVCPKPYDKMDAAGNCQCPMANMVPDFVKGTCICAMNTFWNAATSTCDLIPCPPNNFREGSWCTPCPQYDYLAIKNSLVGTRHRPPALIRALVPPERLGTRQH